MRRGDGGVVNRTEINSEAPGSLPPPVGRQRGRQPGELDVAPMEWEDPKTSESSLPESAPSPSDVKISGGNAQEDKSHRLAGSCLEKRCQR